MKFEVAETLLGFISELEANGVEVPDFDQVYEALVEEAQNENELAHAVEKRIEFCENLKTTTQEEETFLIKEIALLKEWQDFCGKN